MDPHCMSLLLCKESDLQCKSPRFYISSSPDAQLIQIIKFFHSTETSTTSRIDIDHHWNKQKNEPYASFNVDYKIVFYFMIVFLLACKNEDVYGDDIVVVEKNYQKEEIISINHYVIFFFLYPPLMQKCYPYLFLYWYLKLSIY